MAAAFVAERLKGGTTSTSFGLSVSGITTGNHIIILIGIATPASGSRSVLSVTDNASGGSNTYQIDISTAAVSGGTAGLALISAYIDPAKGAPTVITITMNANSTIGYKIEEFSGLATTAWFDVGTSAACQATTGQTTASVTPAASGELAIAAGVSGSPAQSSFTVGAIGGTNGTQAGTPRNATVDVGFEYLLSCAAGAQTGAWTWASAPVSTNAGRDVLAFYKLPATAVTSQPDVARSRQRRRTVYR